MHIEVTVIYHFISDWQKLGNWIMSNIGIDVKIQGSSHAVGGRVDWYNFSRELATT